MNKLKLTSIIAFATLTISSFIACNNDQKLPILGHREAVVNKDANGKQVIDTVYQTIPNFTFLNQDSVELTQDSFKDKIYIADFFFTSCTTICPTMHRHLKELYDQYQSNPEVMYLSHSIDFKKDKPAVLKEYAKKLGVDTKKWQFVCGSKENIYNLAEKNYLTVVGEDPTTTDGYMHQGWLVLIDKERRMRGAYDGTQPEEVAKLKKDVVKLLAEYKTN